MAEAGLLPFALQVSEAALPRYPSRSSKHQFNQPQLLASDGLGTGRGQYLLRATDAS